MKKQLTLNTEQLKQDQFSEISINLASSTPVRHAKMEDKEFLVVPCIMITEGVHNGSNGPLYYPKEELSKTPEVWNHKPVVVYHPVFNGVGVSACDPEILTNQKIGVLMNTKWDGKKGQLKTECWLEEEKTRKVDDRVMNALDGGTVVEVSTGLFSDYEMSEGEWNGKKYTAIARNYRPDHLAVLPDQVGACSVADGAGLLRNVAQEEKNTPAAFLANSLLAIYNSLSHSDVWDKLNVLVRQEKGDGCWVSDVWDDFCIYEKDGDSFYQEYTVEDKEVKLKGIPIAAKKLRQYQLADGVIVGNKTEGKEKENMRQKVVDSLIKNSDSSWTEDDREFLMGLTDNRFSIIVANEKPIEKPIEKPAPVINTETKPATPQTVDEFVNNAPPELQDVLRHGIASHQREKAAAIKKITDNSRNTFTSEFLAEKSIDELNALVALAETPTTNVIASRPIFAGLGETVMVNSQAIEEALPTPVMNFGTAQ